MVSQYPPFHALSSIIPIHILPFMYCSKVHNNIQSKSIIAINIPPFHVLSAIIPQYSQWKHDSNIIPPFHNHTGMLSRGIPFTNPTYPFISFLLSSIFATALLCTSSGPSARRRILDMAQNWAKGKSDETPAPPKACKGQIHSDPIHTIPGMELSRQKTGLNWSYGIDT